jgi:uncharacterized membrane protein
MFHRVLVTFLPHIIAFFELVGIAILSSGALRATYYYLSNLFFKKQYDFRLILSDAMITGLEFKMVAEILKTVLVTSISELYVLGVVILLRGLIALMIYFEQRAVHSSTPISYLTQED